jgi:hypothetical protein
MFIWMENITKQWEIYLNVPASNKFKERNLEQGKYLVRTQLQFAIA